MECLGWWPQPFGKWQPPYVWGCCPKGVRSAFLPSPSFEGRILFPAGVLAAHKIMASSPDMDQATVSALRVGATLKQIGSLTEGQGGSGCTVAPYSSGKSKPAIRKSPDAASLPCHEYSW